MGLLDSLIKRGVRNAVNDVTRRAEDAATNTIGNAVEDAVTSNLSKLLGTDLSRKPASSGTGSSAASSENAAPKAASAGGSNNVVKLNKRHNESFTPDSGAIASTIGDRGCAEYFKDVIEKNVAGASVRTNVALSEVSNENPAKQARIDVLVSINGTPKLAILLPSKNDYRKYMYLNTMNACEAVGIAAIRFMKEFENAPGYVSARVKAVIG